MDVFVHATYLIILFSSQLHIYICVCTTDTELDTFKAAQDIANNASINFLLDRLLIRCSFGQNHTLNNLELCFAHCALHSKCVAVHRYEEDNQCRFCFKLVEETIQGVHLADLDYLFVNMTELIGE